LECLRKNIRSVTEREEKKNSGSMPIAPGDNADREVARRQSALATERGQASL